MALLGLEVIGADDGGLIGAAPDWLKKAGAAVIPAAASAAEGALADKPKDGDKPKDAKASAKPDEEGFFSKTLFWKVRVWHAFLGVVAAGGGVAWWKLRK